MSEYKITNIMLERFLLNELSPGELDFIKQKLETDPLLRKKLRDLESSNQQILSEYDSKLVSRQIYQKISARESKPRHKHQKGWFNFTLAISGFATVIMVILILGPGVTHRNTTVSEITRIKGEGQRLYIYKKQHNKTIILNDHDKVKEGDLLQISYYCNREIYGMIFSIDGRGQITLHYPVSGDTFAKLQASNKTYLDSSYQLDDAPGFEQFFIITSEKPEKINDILQIAENQKELIKSDENQLLKLGSGFNISSIRLRKINP